ncbi:hypothetical protein ACS0TY_016113 [Phlomoides rotata]
MDLKLFKLDIDELMNEFVECKSTSFAEFKRVWISRKFSFIFEAVPSTNQGLFMQSLYAHSIGELRQLTKLVIDAKTMGVKIVAAILKSMLERNMFLFGSVCENEGSATDRVNELTDVQNTRVQTAYKKLFSNSRLEQFIHMDMDMELDVDVLKKSSFDYAAAKELAIKEASQVIDVENIKHIAENKRLMGDIVEKTVTDWKSQKESFYEQTGIRPVAIPPHEEEIETAHQKSSNENRKRKEPCDNDHEWNANDEELEDQDDFEKELEEALLFQPEECDNEEAEPTDEEDM